MATINCVSLGTMGLGGTMWAFDIANVKEAQARLRGRLNYDTIYQNGEAVPESILDLLVASQETVIEEEESKNDTNGPETPR